MNRYLSADEVDGDFIRAYRFVYAKTKYKRFFYSEFTAKKIFWRFFWLAKRPKLCV